MTGALRRLEEISRSLSGAGEAAQVDYATVRIVEAILFSAPAPMDRAALAARLPAGTDVEEVVGELTRLYSGRGVNLVRVAGGWAFRTAGDLAFVLGQRCRPVRRSSPGPPWRCSRSWPTISRPRGPRSRRSAGSRRPRGRSTHLIETGWVRLRGRRRAPGRPITYGTTPSFLVPFRPRRNHGPARARGVEGAWFPGGPHPRRPRHAESRPTVRTLMPDEDPLEPDLGSITPFEAEE